MKGRRALSRVVALVAAMACSAMACGRTETSVGALLPDGALVPDTAPPAVSRYFEAESGVLTGFTIASDANASAGAYILPPADSDASDAPGESSAVYTFIVDTPGTYRIWGRIQGPEVEHNSFWVSLDDEPAYVWRLSTGDLWFWSTFTRDFAYDVAIEYALAPGTHRLVVRNRNSGVGLDRLYFALPGEAPPANDTSCAPPHSIRLADGGCEPSCGSHGGTTCGAAACTGQTPLAAYDCDICCFEVDAGAQDASADGAVDAQSNAAVDAANDADASAD